MLPCKAHHQGFSTDSSCINGHPISKPDWLVVNGSVSPVVAAASGKHTGFFNFVHLQPISVLHESIELTVSSEQGKTCVWAIAIITTADLMNALLSLR